MNLLNKELGPRKLTDKERLAEEEEREERIRQAGRRADRDESNDEFEKKEKEIKIKLEKIKSQLIEVQGLGYSVNDINAIDIWLDKVEQELNQVGISLDALQIIENRANKILDRFDKILPKE